MNQKMSNITGHSDVYPNDQTSDIRSIREVNGEIEDGPCDVLVFNDDVYYPLIDIEPKSIFKPSIINIKPNSVFIEDETSSNLKKAYFKWRSEGFCSSLEYLSSLQPDQENEENDGEEHWSRKIIKNIAYYLLYMWRKILLIYVYFYPYALMNENELCETFCKFNNFDGIIRHIAWHPKKHKVALALSNDNVYIYSSNLITPLLKHPLQKKITDMKWSPMNENQLTIACAHCIIKWNIDPNEKSVRLPIKHAEILKDDFQLPITCFDYTSNGKYLLVSSPSSSKIQWINQIKNQPTQQQLTNRSSLNDILHHQKVNTKQQTDNNVHNNDEQNVRNLRVFGTTLTFTITFFFLSPDNTRIAVGSTEFGIRIYETENFTWKNWGKDLKAIAKCACWNNSNGRILLFTMRTIPKVYAVIFYDKAEANYVGGTNSYIPVLDVRETELDNGLKVGGLVQNIIWDQNCERLVIAFIDNPHHLAVYRTRIKPSLEITSIGFIHGLKDELPLCYSFHYAFKNGSLLTVCWSSGYVSHIPLQYDQNDKNNRTLNRTQLNATNVRSLTSFCMSQIMNNDENTSFIQPNTSTLNITKKYFTQDSVVSPRKPLLFTSFTENQENEPSFFNN